MHGRVACTKIRHSKTLCLRVDMLTLDCPLSLNCIYVINYVNCDDTMAWLCHCEHNRECSEYNCIAMREPVHSVEILTRNMQLRRQVITKP